MQQYGAKTFGTFYRDVTASNYRSNLERLSRVSFPELEAAWKTAVRFVIATSRHIFSARPVICATESNRRDLPRDTFPCFLLALLTQGGDFSDRRATLHSRSKNAL